MPSIVVNDFCEVSREGQHSRSSTEDSEQTPLIQSEKVQKPKKRESSGSLLDLKNVRNVFSRVPTRSHSGDFVSCDMDLENGNLGSQSVCEPCKLFSMPDKNKTMSQPSVLHVENEKSDYNANKQYKRRGSVQFTLPKGGCGDGPSQCFDGDILGRRSSACSSIPEKYSDHAWRSDNSGGTSSHQDCRIHCNPRRIRNRSTSTSMCSEKGEDPSVTYLQNRRTSRTFTVINYGDGSNNSTSTNRPDVRRPSQQAEVDDPIDEAGHEIFDDVDSTCGSMVSSASRLQQVLNMKAQKEGMDYLKRPSSLSSEKETLSTDLQDLEQQIAYRRKSLKTCTIRSLPQVARRGALFARRKKHRLVNKEGDFNIHFRNISNRNKRYLADVFTTLLDMQWRFNLLLFIIAFVVSWVSFAMLWWLISFLHGDTKPLAPSEIINSTIPCVVGVTDFTSALLFSIETQHTIGYGVRAMTTSCSEAVILLMVQSIFGVVIQCVMAGVVLAKLARPKRRGETIMFSQNAVICQEDGQYCLIFRVGDMRRSQLVGAMLHAMFVKKRVTQEGDEIPFYQCHLEVTAESEDYDQFIFLSWPIRIVHRISMNSPLWNMCAEGLLTEDFEIIVVLEGVVEATGMCMQVRTSYLPSEIIWGHRLSPLHTVCNTAEGVYEIDYAHFHTTVPVEMPEYCAFEQHSRKHSRDDDDIMLNVPQQRRRLLSMSESYYGSHAALPINLGV